MSENNERNFFDEFIKWFFIWNIIILIGKGIVFLFKIFIIAIQQLIYLIMFGIAKISPILKEKFAEFCNNYNTKYKFQLEGKWQEVKMSFSNIKDKGKNLLSRISLKVPNKKTKQFSRIRNSNIILFIKKLKYKIIDFFHKYELQIIIITIIVIIIFVILYLISLRFYSY